MNIVDGDDRTYKEFENRANTTKDGHARAIKFWNAFASVQKYPSFEQLTQKIVCGDVLENGSLSNEHNPPIKQWFWQFASYVYEYRKNDGIGEPLQPDGAMQIFTQLKAVMFKKFPPLGYTGDSPDWYQQVYNGLRIRVNVACIARGGKLSRKAVGMPREVLKKSCEWLMKQDDFALASGERAILATLYHAVGRGSEVASANWGSAYWNAQLELFVFDWGEFKRGEQQEMTFSSDAESWELDFHHCLACSLIGGNGVRKVSASDTNINWIFPQVVNLADGGAASMVGRILDKCRPNVDGIPIDTNCHGLRVTGTDEMIFCPMLSLFSAIARGGWNFKSESQAFGYFTQKKHVVAGGLALAGFYNPNIKVHAPSLAAIGTDATTVAMLNKFSGELFNNVGVPELATTLKDYRDVLVASLLMYYEQVLASLGKDSPIIKTMRLAAINVGSDIATLAQWGEAVRDRYIVQNAANIGGGDGNAEKRYAKALSLVTEMCMKTQDKVSSLSAVLHETNERTKRMEDGINTLLLARGVKSPCRPSAAKKQRLEESDSANTTSVAVTKRNAFQTMSSGMMAVQNHVSFKDAGSWTINKFVANVIKSRQFSADKGFCGGITSSTRKRYRYVYDGLVALASDSQKQYFDPNKAPVWDEHHSHPGGVDRDLWFRELDKVVIGLAKKLIRNYLKRKARAQKEQGETDEQLLARFNKLLNSQKQSVGSVGNLIEKVKGAETKGVWS